MAVDFSSTAPLSDTDVEPSKERPSPSAEPNALNFPRDEGWHSFLPFGRVASPRMDFMEWYYINAHLVGRDGHRYVAMVAYFAQALRLMSLTRFEPDGHTLTHQHSEPAIGLLRAHRDRHDMSFRHPGGEDRWHRVGNTHAGQRGHATLLRASAGLDRMALTLEQRSEKPTYAAGNRGYMPFADNGWFHYYSMTRLSVRGKVTFIDDGKTREDEVIGVGWFDHQWGPFYVTPLRNPGFYETYEWHGLQLSDGSDLLLTSVWDRNGHSLPRDSYGGAGWIRPDGTSTHHVGSHHIRRLGFHRDPGTGAIYSAGWRLDVPEWRCELRIHPRVPNQMVMLAPSPPPRFDNRLTRGLQSLTNFAGSFWEGSCTVEGWLDGVHVTGHAFSELIKRYEHPKVVFEKLSFEHDGRVTLRWRVTNPDPNAELFYRIRVLAEDDTVLFEIDDIDVSVQVLPAEPLRGRRCRAIIVAHSQDWVLKGQAVEHFEIPQRRG
jgi:predicted secreted hydrolase